MDEIHSIAQEALRLSMPAPICGNRQTAGANWRIKRSITTNQQQQIDDLYCRLKAGAYGGSSWCRRRLHHVSRPPCNHQRIKDELPSQGLGAIQMVSAQVIINDVY